MKHRILFICSRNQWRSPTAEEVYRRHAGLQVRSRGTRRSARRQVTFDDLRWADLICVMEPKHKQHLLAGFPDVMRFKNVHVLDIPDDYRYLDPELVDLVRSAMEPVIELLASQQASDDSETDSEVSGA